MRILEIILLALVTILPFYISSKNNQNQKLPLMVLCGILVLHFLLEGYRWQMIPIYLISLILIGCLIKGYTFFKGGWFRKSMSALVLFLFLGIGGMLSSILPVFSFPTPTGTHSVGSQYLHLKTNQAEVITEEEGDKRELMIKVWYPANLNNEKKEVYLNDGDRIGFATKYGLPKSIFNYLNHVKTNTYDSPSVTDGKFPVLIFSHGSYSKASGYYALIEEIVSHGYIVLNINHTYESVGTLFPNGEIKLYDSDYDRKYNNQAMAEMAWKANEGYKQAKNREEQHLAIEDCLRNYIAADITRRWAKDFSLVIDQLEEWNASTFLSEKIDFSKLGVFGHSQGGSAAGQALINDNRIKAGINLDGVQWGEMIDTFMTKPFALLSSDWPESHPNFNEHAFQNGSTNDFYKAKVLNSGHSNFMDIPLMINLSAVNEAGTIDPNKAIEITSTIVLQFFDKYLMNESIDLLKLSNDFSDLEIELYK